MSKVFLNERARYMRSLLEQYKEKTISPEGRQDLLTAVSRCYKQQKVPIEEAQFEMVINRYMLINPLSLMEIEKLYCKADMGVSAWEVIKGITLLSRFLPEDTPGGNNASSNSLKRMQ